MDYKVDKKFVQINIYSRQTTYYKKRGSEIEPISGILKMPDSSEPKLIKKSKRSEKSTRFPVILAQDPYLLVYPILLIEKNRG